MKLTVLTVFIVCFSILGLSAQNSVKGIVVDGNSEKPLKAVLFTMSNNNAYAIKTN